MSTETANVKKVLSGLERLKKRHMGKYLDTISDVYFTEHGWNREITIAAIEAAKSEAFYTTQWQIRKFCIVLSTRQLTFPLMTSTIMRDEMHHGTSSHGFGWDVAISM